MALNTAKIYVCVAFCFHVFSFLSVSSVRALQHIHGEADKVQWNHFSQVTKEDKESMIDGSFYLFSI